MTENARTIYNMIKINYGNDRLPSHTELIDFIKMIIEFNKDNSITSEEIDEIIDEYEYNVGVKAFDPDTLIGEQITSEWFLEKKKSLSDKTLYWNRYEEYLRNNKDFDESTIKILKRSTEEILSYCVNPDSLVQENVKRKGLVIGDVQSGKTANYLGLINLACDYGYKLIVVLAGLTDSLRKQTQQRVDEGFIGAVSNTIGSANIRYTGVGISPKPDRYAVTLTNLDKDFKRESMSALNSTSADYNKPVILVVKKNKSTLENVKTWLKPGTSGVTDHVLIIDDEADNASVNTKNEDSDPSTINGLIRDLFNNFLKSTYVGFTATPFANIFINPNDEESYKDLFPTDFITLLKTPTSYFGAEKVFGKNNDGNSEYLRIIDEDERYFLPVNHKREDSFDELSESLKEAIHTFFINCVIRTKRGKPFAHRSMMINISRFNQMQSKIKNKIVAYVKYLTDVIVQSSYMTKEKFLRNKEIKKMYDLFSNSNYYAILRQEIDWNTIQENLSFEAEKMKVIVVNRLKDEDKLDYMVCKNEGARYIVIGGFVLSRGLTLEGLMVSYYSRKGSAYDTLLQMCRWFGYRHKYEDLCRIYMSPINIENFCAVIDATNDLKQQFNVMKLSKKSPDQFGLMVKTCPDILNTLLVTSRNKSRTTTDRTFTCNFSCKAIDTSKIFKDKLKNISNLMVLQDLIEKQLGDLQCINGRFMYRNVSKELITSIIRKIEIPLENNTFDKVSLCDFLRESKNFNSWDIVVATGNDNKNAPKFKFGGKDLNPVLRSFNYRKADNESFVRIAGNNNRLIDPGILNAGMDQDVIQKVREEVGSNKTPTADNYLKYRKNPILIIYPIVLKNDDDSIVKQEIIKNLDDNFLIGFGIGFPFNGDGISIKYKLNIRKQEEMRKQQEMMEDDYEN